MAVILPESLQQDLQGSLPILPNNGNPGGAYNVASAEQPAQQAAPAPDPYAWLKPSAYMDQVNEIIKNQDAILDMAVSSLLTPEVKYSGWNDKVGNGRFQFEPVDELGLPIPQTVGTPTHLWPVYTAEEDAPQYRPILPGE